MAQNLLSTIKYLNSNLCKFHAGTSADIGIGCFPKLANANGRFKTTVGHFFTNYINIFYKTDRLNLSFVKDIDADGKKMTRSGLKMAI